MKQINKSRKKQLTLSDFQSIGELHLTMERYEVEIVDDYKNLR